SLEWPSFDRKFYYDKENTLEEKLDSQLSLSFITFKELSTKSNASPKNLEQYYKNLEIFKEMRSTDISEGYKFVEVLKKTENDEFVIKNTECQLAINGWSQNLWKAYIKYLEIEKKDFMAMLQVLSRYCRLFISDKNMNEKYQKKVEEMSQHFDGISEFWIDLIKFEL
uniref:Uncharacterized protein n=1 Tax=Panagrolaimus sp. ES5 TaxID=591445 RepID=A0AC34FVC2_9BILA